jgi:hypothetical protein
MALTRSHQALVFKAAICISRRAGGWGVGGRGLAKRPLKIDTTVRILALGRSSLRSPNVPLLSDGHNSASWAADLKSKDFELLCLDGGRAPVDQYAQCNLAQVPPHMVSAGRKEN